MTKATIKIIKEIGEELQGTCNNIDSVFEEHGLDIESTPQALLRELDEITMECQTCGWWCEPFELANGNCYDCAEDKEEDV